MKDLPFGRLIRTARVQRRWTQAELGRRARVSTMTVWRVEHGQVDALRLGTVRAVAAALEISLELLARGRGADLDRLVNADHSALHEAVLRVLVGVPGWTAASEVSFNIWGERGVIDILLWHPARRALLIIELKTELVDPGGLIAVMDIRCRLGPEIARQRGWDPVTVSTWVIVTRSRTSERRLGAFRSMLRTAFPVDGRGMRGWLRDPVGSVAALSLWDGPAPVTRVR
jgi:HTH-type transcriptional regulator / antitoxin HipB